MPKRTKQDVEERRSEASHAILKPSASMANAIGAVYSQTRIDSDGTTGLDLAALQAGLIIQNLELESGDMRRIEAMLLDQSHALQAIFSHYTQCMMAAEYVDQMSAFAGIALKAQNQCRQTLATLGELKNPKRATFIKQQNNAVNQQINQDSAPENSQKNPVADESKLVGEVVHEQLDFGAPREILSNDLPLEAVGEVDRTTNG